jgi:Ca-activated chloride channel family protein
MHAEGTTPSAWRPVSASTMAKHASVVAIVLLSGSIVAAQQEGRFSVKSELVVVHAAVTDGRGRFISGLPPHAFSVFEDGRPQAVSFFAEQDAPVTVGLVIDGSGSMLRNRDQVLAAITGFAESSHPDDQFFALVFNEHVKRALPPSKPFTSEPAVLREALTRSLNVYGRTALHDALDAALGDIMAARHERRVLIVLSDGGDNASRLTLEEVRDKVLASNVVVYTVALFDPLLSERNPKALRRLAGETGGLAFEPKSTELVASALRAVAADIRSSYTLAYSPAASGNDGRLRRVRVTVEAPEISKPKVRTRTGYIAGAPASLANELEVRE